MTVRARFLVFALIAASVVSVFSVHTASAAELSDEQLGRIKANCLSIKGSLNQLHASDALLRVNRGQLYESIGARLMNNFNSRLSNNSLDNKGLVAVTQSYQTAQTNFRNSYREYEVQLSAAIRIDCTKDPEAFHNAIESARIKRATTRADVVRMNQYIDDYRSAVNDFMLNFERVTGKT